MKTCIWNHVVFFLSFKGLMLPFPYPAHVVLMLFVQVLKGSLKKVLHLIKKILQTAWPYIYIYIYKKRVPAPQKKSGMNIFDLFFFLLHRRKFGTTWVWTHKFKLNNSKNLSEMTHSYYRTTTGQKQGLKREWHRVTSPVYLTKQSRNTTSRVKADKSKSYSCDPQQPPTGTEREWKDN